MQLLFFLFTLGGIMGTVYGREISPLVKEELIQESLVVRERAYAPYSNYPVGAALLTEEGHIISGCNVENASFGLTICAERAAVFNAVSQGVHSIRAVAIATKDGGAPCGACRQVLNEFSPQALVILVNEKGEVIEENSLDYYLPRSFGPKDVLSCAEESEFQVVHPPHDDPEVIHP